MVEWTDEERALVTKIFTSLNYEEVGPQALGRCLVVYPWTQRYFGNFGNLYNADAILSNPMIAAHGIKIVHGLDMALKNMDNIKETYANLSVLHSEKLHVDPDNFRVARWEYRSHALTRLFGGPYLGCYCLGFVIVLLNVYRSHSMTVVMNAQPRWELMAKDEIFYFGGTLLVLGTLLVVSSFLALGFTGTFLGDYFGILMEEKVTSFPFNLIENPMYWGSTANYLGLALIGASPVGLVLTAVVALVYKVAIAIEGPFTEHIYRERSQHWKQQ